MEAGDILQDAAAAAEAKRYKALHEAFVSDHYGSSLLDINTIAAIAPAAVLLWSVLQLRLKIFEPYHPLAYLADFLINCGGILFATTMYADNPYVLLGLLLLPALSVYVNHRPAIDPKRPQKPSTVKDGGKQDEEVIDPLPIKPFVTHYRGAMMVITCISILAVDFPVFPRRFAKTESIGTSLMDLGVGSFVFAAGLVSVRNTLKEESGDAPKTSFVTRFKNSLRHAIPLIVLGFVRLYTVKKLNYAEHVTEYGEHWNFFFTLAAIGPFVALFEPLGQYIPSVAIVGAVISVTMETVAFWTGLLYWLAFAPRDNWIAANKEGLASLPGYIAIYIVGQGIGRVILQRDQDPDARDTENDLWLARTLGGDEYAKAMKRAQTRFAWKELRTFSVIMCVVYFILTGKRGPRLIVSRRYANLAYCAWVCAFNTVQLWVFCTIETVCFPDIYKARHKRVELDRVRQATSKVLGAFNRNGLALFLVANLLTGAINMSLKTIEMDDLHSMAVLISYIATLTVVAVGLDNYNISIKI